MARHKNPKHNKRRLVIASVSAVAVLGAAVGIGIYGSALAARGRPAASPTQCLPVVAAPTSAPPTSTTTPEAPPTETAPQETAPTETAPQTTTPTETQPTETQPTGTSTSIPDSSTSSSQAQGLASGDLVALNGARPPKGNGQPTPPDYGGPKPPGQAPQPPAGDPVQSFPRGENCESNLGPFATDFIDIRKVRPNNLAASPRPVRGASTGTFRVNCGNNENGHFNSANVIAAPGNANGAQHTHDYVGNLTTDGFSTNESLAASGTTCRNGDKSAYFWPVIRVRNPGSKAVDPLNAHNVGDIAPVRATIEFRGNARGKVVAAPQFLRILTGDAKSSTNGGARANAKWTCTGFENRITTKYPLCPRGSQTVRIADFPGCNDGNTDSANHRDHLAFADQTGACPAGFQAIPQLRITLRYNLPPGRVFALDSFPDEKHNPLTDHNDFVNVMGERLMNQVVNCINTGRRC